MLKIRKLFIIISLLLISVLGISIISRTVGEGEDVGGSGGGGGCSHTDVGVIEAVPATCTESGLTEGSICNTCKKILVEQEVIPAAHKEVSHEGLAATCTEAGYAAYVTCENCDYTTYTELEALGHNYELSVCTACGKVEGSEGLAYTLSSDETYYICSGMGTCTDTDLVIPAYYEGLPVKEIGSSFSKSLTSLIIPDTVTTIGAYVFRNMSRLNKIIISDNISSIGIDSFSGINKAALTEYGNGYYIGSRTSPFKVLYGESNKDITSCEVHEDTTVVLSNAFSDCLYLENVVFNAKKLAPFTEYSNIFTNAGKLSSGLKFFIGNEVTILPDLFLCDAIYLKEVEFESQSVCSEIGNRVFSSSHYLHSFVIPESVTKLANFAFSGCYQLWEIWNLSSSVNISTDSSYLKSIVDIYTSSESESHVFITDDGYYFYDNGSSVYLLGYNGDSTDLVLPEKLNDKYYSIFKYSFYKSNIVSVIIPEGVYEIRSYAFGGCSSLVSVDFPSTLTTIGQGSFSSCSSLKEIEIGSSVTYIGIRAFALCSSLEKIYFSANSLSLSSSLSPDLFQYKKYSYDVGSAYFIVNDNVTYIPNRLLYVSNAGVSAPYVVLPTSVGEIADYGLYGASHIYYLGTSEQFSSITLGSSAIRTNCLIYYYTETEPTESGNYWHYVDGVPTVWTVAAES